MIKKRIERHTLGDANLLHLDYDVKEAIVVNLIEAYV